MYKEIRFIAGPVLCAKETTSVVSDVSMVSLNDFLKEEFELIQVITHVSAKQDVTATMIILGKK